MTKKSKIKLSSMEKYEVKSENLSNILWGFYQEKGLHGYEAKTREMENWMKEHTKGYRIQSYEQRALLGLHGDHTYSSEVTVYNIYFKNKDDLLLWKLKWGHEDHPEGYGSSFIRWMRDDEEDIDTWMDEVYDGITSDEQELQDSP